MTRFIAPAVTGADIAPRSISVGSTYTNLFPGQSGYVNGDFWLPPPLGGSNDDSAAILAVMQAAIASGGVVRAWDATWNAQNLVPPVGTRMYGTYRWTTGGSFRGTKLQGLAGQPTIKLTDTAASSEFQAIELAGIQFAGGQDCIFAPNGGVGVVLNQLAFSSPSHAGIYFKGFVQEWFGRDLWFNQGQYGFYFNNEAGSGSAVLLDKVFFDRNIYCLSQTINGALFSIGTTSTDVRFDIRIITCQQDGFVVGGTCRQWVFEGFQTERNGQADLGIVADTTGTGASGAAALTVGSGTNYNNGDTVVVAGAGSSGRDLTTTISAGGGTTSWTLGTNILSSVTGVNVTKRRYSNFLTQSNGGTPADFTFIQPKDVGTTLVRYGIDLSQAFRVGFVGGDLGNRAIYDPNGDSAYFNPRALTLRRPALIVNLNATIFAGSAGEIVYEWTLTGNVTLIAVPNHSKGQKYVFTFIQDGTGGWTVAFNPNYKVSWADTGNTLNKRSSITFVDDGTNLNQAAPQTAYV